MTVTEPKTEPKTGCRPECRAVCQGERPVDAGAEHAPADRCVVTRLTHPRPEGEDHYTISEVAAWTGLSAHTLRWYERIGLMPHIDRSHTGQRRFTNRDLDWLSLVAKLRLTGMPVADMVRYAELVREGEHTFAERRELLVATRKDVLHRIAELRDTLSVLDFKIGFYAEADRLPESG
ncbi:MerR family transcriptional regulator [Streptomyces sparsus]